MGSVGRELVSEYRRDFVDKMVRDYLREPEDSTNPEALLSNSDMQAEVEAFALTHGLDENELLTEIRNRAERNLVGSVDFAAHENFKEGQFKRIDDVPILRSLSGGMSVDRAVGYGTKIDGHIVYLQRRPGGVYVANVGGLIASKEYNSLKAAKAGLANDERLRRVLNSPQAREAEERVRYVNANRGVSLRQVQNRNNRRGR